MNNQSLFCVFKSQNAVEGRSLQDQQERGLSDHNPPESYGGVTATPAVNADIKAVEAVLMEQDSSSPSDSWSDVKEEKAKKKKDKQKKKKKDGKKDKKKKKKKYKRKYK